MLVADRSQRVPADAYRRTRTNECWCVPQSGGKSKLVVNSLSFTPIPMKGCDQQFRVLHTEGIDFRPIGFSKCGRARGVLLRV